MPKQYRSLLLFIPAAIIALLLAYFAQYVWFPTGMHLTQSGKGAVSGTTIAPVSDVVISEIMASNRTAWAGADGAYPDWVELYNRGSAPVDITGWTLTDDANKAKQFTFPERSLAAGELLLVYCDGCLQNEAEPYHAPFSLSKYGDSLMLYDAGGAIMEAVAVPALSANQVYARKASAGDYAVTNAYTPGRRNDEATPQAQITGGASNSPIVLNEWMAENESVLKDEDGEYSDWIELYNAGDAPVSLANYALSDESEAPQKWRFPDVTMQPGDYLIVFASGKDRTGGGELHTNFSLNAEGEVLTLTDEHGDVIARVDYGLMKADKSCSRKTDGSYTKNIAPTPGRANA